MLKRLFLFGIILSGFLACKKDDPYETEKLARDKYLVDNNITVSPTPSGLYYIEILKGTGPDADPGEKVRVRYKGTFMDGTVFDSNIYEFILGRGEVISGWDEGIGYMKEGGKAKLIIPSNLAYGPYGAGEIPGYTTLVFNVELLSVN